MVRISFFLCRDPLLNPCVQLVDCSLWADFISRPLIHKARFDNNVHILIVHNGKIKSKTRLYYGQIQCAPSANMCHQLLLLLSQQIMLQTATCDVILTSATVT